MKIHFIQIAFILICTCLFLSCEKTANNVEIPDYTAKLVLHAFISPSDSVVNVQVSTTTNIYGNKNEYPQKMSVSVTLDDGTSSYSFSERNDTSGICTLNYKIKAGQTYKIKAHCEGYPDAQGECIVPKIKDFHLEIDTLSVIENNGWGYFYPVLKINTKFQDIPNENNFFNLYGVRSFSNMYGNYSEMIPIDNNSNNYNFYLNELISDHLQDGQELGVNFNEDYNSLRDTFVYSINIQSNLLETDENYYKYHTSLKTYQNGDNPFTEFSPVYSNIEGGYGIFCAYVKYEKTIILK